MAGPYSPDSTNVVLTVARMLPNGAVDAAFGAGGSAKTPTIGKSTPLDVGLEIQADGKILVGASVGGKVLLARLDASGSLDTSFGNQGMVELPFEGLHMTLLGIRAIAGGKIVLFANYRSGITKYYLARLSSNGALDPTFGSGGTVAIEGSATLSGEGALVIQPDGKLLAVSDVTLRLSADGENDTAFGTNGFASVALDAATDAVVQPDGKIVFSGYGPSGGAAVARLLADGTRDMTFGTSSFRVIPTSGSEAYGAGIALQPDGKIVVGGCDDPLSSSSNAFLVARLASDGSLDPSFGVGGTASRHVAEYECTRALLRQADGKVVVAGGKFTAVRFLP